MNNLFKLTPIVGSIKNAIRPNHLQKMTYCSVDESQKNYEKSVNHIMLLGRMGADPQVRGNDKTPVVSFSIATNFNYKSNDKWVQRPDWHTIVIFDKHLRQQALSYGAKGARVLVTGRVSYSDYIDKEGKLQNVTNIVASEVTYIHGLKQNN